MKSTHRSLTEKIHAQGHENVTSEHETTLMFTRDDYLTPTGDCIVAINADKAIADLDESFLEKLRDNEAEIEILIECEGIQEKIKAKGHENLVLTHEDDMVIRKSDYICERTLAIKADKAACDLKRKLVEEIAKGAEVFVTLRLN